MYIPTTSNTNIGMGNLGYLGLYPASNQSYMTQYNMTMSRRGYITSIDTPNSCIQGGMNHELFTYNIRNYKGNNRFWY